jgi:hypothetical protein
MRPLSLCLRTQVPDPRTMEGGSATPPDPPDHPNQPASVKDVGAVSFGGLGTWFGAGEGEGNGTNTSPKKKKAEGSWW